MNIYLAGSFSRCEELNGYADELRSLGHIVDCRWLEGFHQVHPGAWKVENSEEMPPEAERFAIDDLKDLYASDIVVSFTGTGAHRGGRHVEFGMGVAWGKRMIVVGKRENVFHCLPVVEFFEDWPSCLRALAEDT